MAAVTREIYLVHKESKPARYSQLPVVPAPTNGLNCVVDTSKVRVRTVNTRHGTAILTGLAINPEGLLDYRNLNIVVGGRLLHAVRL